MTGSTSEAEIYGCPSFGMISNLALSHFWPYQAYNLNLCIMDSVAERNLEMEQESTELMSARISCPSCNKIFESKKDLQVMLPSIEKYILKTI